MRLEPFRFISVVFTISLLIFFSGCFGGGGIGDYTETVDIQLNDNDGWQAFIKNQTDKAQVYFYRLLSADPTDKIKDEAFTGLGWCALRKGTLDEAIGFFRSIKAMDVDSKVGLAGALTKKGGTANFKEAIAQLESLGLSDPKVDLKSSRELHYTSDNLHGLLGILYIINGQREKGLQQFQITLTRKNLNSYLKTRLPAVIDFFTTSI
ncbi:MAG: hypothetical protein PHW04_19060 [Candidatus Wallbacteria bacterium]|nr:hypothetical protein [Candidatus Wallbacteria bacterium]